MFDGAAAVDFIAAIVAIIAAIVALGVSHPALPPATMWISERLVRAWGRSCNFVNANASAGRRY